MYGLQLALSPPLAEYRPLRLPCSVRKVLHDGHFMEVIEKAVHIAYCGLLFIEGGPKWYVWCALPLLIVSTISVFSIIGDK